MNFNKSSKEGKITILVVACLSIGFLAGQFNIQRVINIDSMKEAFLFNTHTAYLRGCVENLGPGHWSQCVQGAQNTTKDMKDILDQEPSRMFHSPVPPPSSGQSTTPPTIEELIKKSNKKTIMI